LVVDFINHIEWAFLCLISRYVWVYMLKGRGVECK